MAASKANMPANENSSAPAGEASAVNQDALSVTQLAKGVLARDFRPRTASVRRLAEAVLAKDAAKTRKKKKKPAKASGKKRKLAKIPGQKGKKKG